MQPPELDVNGAVLRWVVASTTIKCKKQPCINLPTLCFYVIMLECTKGHVKIAKSKAKHSLKETINKIEDSTINHLKVAAFKNLSSNVLNSKYSVNASRHLHERSIRKKGYCYISLYSIIYEYILSIVNIASKGNPPSIVATYSCL